MGLFSLSRPKYDRKQILDEAVRARQKRRTQKAIKLYRRVLAVERNNAELHAQIAPLLADAGLCFEAWESYRIAVHALLQADTRQRALDLYRDATRRLPTCYEAWVATALLELQLGQRDAAVNTLRAGRRQFRSRRTRAQAISLLRKLLEIEPKQILATMDLAGLLAKNGQEAEALHLLAQLAERTRGGELRRVRKAQWSITPTLSHTWLWLRSARAT